VPERQSVSECSLKAAVVVNSDEPIKGNFEASVLLLDTVWDISFAKHIKGEFVAAVPARDVLAFGDSSSAETVAELRAIINRLKSTGPITRYLHPSIVVGTVRSTFWVTA
jgi:hypothetical protein